MRRFLAEWKRDWKRWSQAERIVAIVMLIGAVLAPAVVLAGA